MENNNWRQGKGEDGERWIFLREMILFYCSILAGQNCRDDRDSAFHIRFGPIHGEFNRNLCM